MKYERLFKFATYAVQAGQDDGRVKTICDIADRQLSQQETWAFLEKCSSYVQEQTRNINLKECA